MARFAPIKLELRLDTMNEEAKPTRIANRRITTDISSSGDVTACKMAWKRIVQWPPCPLCPQTRFIFIVLEDSNRSGGVCSNVPFVPPREFLPSALAAWLFDFSFDRSPRSLDLSENTLWTWGWGWISRDSWSEEGLKWRKRDWKDLKSSFNSAKKNGK